MPTYVYKFVDTGETIEVQQDFSDDTLTEARHPVDGTVRPVKKVFLPVGITFKGSGFYKTDSKSGSSSSSTKDTGSSGSTESTTSSTTAESGSSGSTTESSGTGSSGTGSSGATGTSTAAPAPAATA